jgi:hypothetical protein
LFIIPVNLMLFSFQSISKLLDEQNIKDLSAAKDAIDELGRRAMVAAAAAVAAQGYGPRARPLPVRTHEAEQAAHLAFLQANLKDRSLWETYGLARETASTA